MQQYLRREMGGHLSKVLLRKYLDCAGPGAYAAAPIVADYIVLRVFVNMRGVGGFNTRGRGIRLEAKCQACSCRSSAVEP